MADTQTFEGIMKDVFENEVAEGVNNKFPLKDMFRTQTKGFKGRQIVRGFHHTRNASPMATGERGAFPEAEPQGHAQFTIGQKKLMARAEITWEGSVDAAGGEASFVQGKKDEFKRLIDDIARRDEHYLAGYGSGILAFLDGEPGTDADEVELDAPGGIAGDNFGNRYVDKNMWVGAVNPATGVLRSGVVKVNSVNSDGTGFTPSAAIDTAWADNDYLVQVAGSGTTDVLDTSYEHAWWGLMALIDDGTYRDNYFSLLRSVHDALKSYVLGSTGAISMDLLQRVSDILDQKLGGRVDRIVSHHSVRRLYLQITEADRRYSGNSLKSPDHGTVAFKQGDLTVGEVKYSAIRTFPLATMMLLDTANSDFVKYESESGKFVDEDGNMLVRIGTGSSARDAFEAWYRMRKQYFCENPGYNARLDGITGQTLVVQRDY